MPESLSPRTDALKAQGIEWVPIGRMKDVESELAATRARLAELEWIAERLASDLRAVQEEQRGDVFAASIREFKAYKEGKK